MYNLEISENDRIEVEKYRDTLNTIYRALRAKHPAEPDPIIWQVAGFCTHRHLVRVAKGERTPIT